MSQEIEYLQTGTSQDIENRIVKFQIGMIDVLETDEILTTPVTNNGSSFYPIDMYY